MKHTNKKGFTIVELVIVIAVIAILAAVLIPTFSNLIKKANQSSDIQAVRQMNTVLSAEQGLGEDIDRVIDVLVENGYSANGLTPVTADHKFVYVATYERIVLINEKNEVVFPKEIEIAEGAVTFNLGESVKYIDVVADSVDDIVAALAAGSEYIKLDADISITRDVYVVGENVTLDLNGHTYNTVQNSNGRSGVIYVDAGASLTVTNGTLNVRSIQLEGGDLIVKAGVTINAMDVTGGSCIRNKGNGTVTIEGGTFNVVNYIAWDEINYGGAAAVYNSGTGSVIVKDGTFTSNTTAYLISNAGEGKIEIEGGSFTAHRGALAANSGEIIVNGGTFKVTNGENGGRVAYTGETGSIVLNGGEFSPATPDNFYGNVTGEKAPQ